MIIIYDGITKKIESAIKWPSKRKYPNPIPEGKKKATIETLPLNSKYYNEATGLAEPAPYAEQLATAKAEKISAIKEATNKHILYKYPIYRQLNVLIDGVEEKLTVMRKYIQAARTSSDISESAIMVCTDIADMDNQTYSL